MIRQWLFGIFSNPIELLIGSCIFLAVALGGARVGIASTCLGIAFVTSLFYVRKWPELWRSLTKNEQLLLLALFLYALSGLISYYNVSDQYEFVKHMGRYLRFAIIIPIYLLFAKPDMQLFKYLVAGAVAAGPLSLTFALISISANPEEPATWHYHHITFGDAAMVNALFLLAVLLGGKTSTILKAVMLVSVLCGFYASILSQARGAWIALPFCVAALLYMLARQEGVKIKVISISLIFLLAIAMLSMTPVATKIGHNVDQTVQEVDLFMSGEKSNSSVGGRLAMWHIALDVWQSHPIIGTGLADFDQEIERRQAQGIYEDIAVHASVHNIYLQALATTGSVGFLILCFALIVQPLRVLYRASRKKISPAAMAGVIVVLAYAVFGLTESWILRSPVIAMYLIYLMTLSTTVSREEAAIKPRDK